MHVFYPELVGELVHHLSVLPPPYDLLVTNATGDSVPVDAADLPSADRLATLEVENRGRDLWPLVQLANAGLLDAYDLVLKVHTKRSAWRDEHRGLPGTGRIWRERLLSDLLGERSNVEAVLGAFRQTPRLGMVTGDGSVLGPDFWGQDRRQASALMRRIGLRPTAESLVFAAGSMYWVRASVLRRLADLRLSRADFDPELGQVDGTTAHALERVIGMLTLESGLEILERSQVGLPTKFPA